MSETAKELQDPSENKESIENTRHFKERAERNRQKALLLKKSKIVSHPYTKGYVVRVINFRLLTKAGSCRCSTLKRIIYFLCSSYR